jgi:MscS family membrane protein
MLETTFYMNTVSQWIVAFVIVLGFVIVGKIVYWVATNILKKFAKETKTQLDDILIETMQEPLALIIITTGVLISFETLNTTAIVDSFVTGGIYFVYPISIAWFLSRLLDAIVIHYLQPLAEASSSSMDDQLLPIVRKGLKLAIWSIAILIGLNNAGFNIGALLAGLGIGGLAFAMAAKDTVANLFAGFTILVDKPFVLGQRIKTDGFDGVVEEIGLRVSRIRTLNGRIVTMANADIANGAVENISSEPHRKISFSLGLTYDMDENKITKAMSIVENIIKQTKGVKDECVVWFDSFGDFSLNISVIYYIIKGENITLIKNNINLNILKEFNQHKIDMAFPTQTVKIDK